MEITIHLVCGYDLTYVSDINEISKNINYLKKYSVFTARETLKNELYDACQDADTKYKNSPDYDRRELRYAILYEDCDGVAILFSDYEYSSDVCPPLSNWWEMILFNTPM